MLFRQNTTPNQTGKHLPHEILRMLGLDFQHKAELYWADHLWNNKKIQAGDGPLEVIWPTPTENRAIQHTSLLTAPQNWLWTFLLSKWPVQPLPNWQDFSCFLEHPRHQERAISPPFYLRCSSSNWSSAFSKLWSSVGSHLSGRDPLRKEKFSQILAFPSLRLSSIGFPSICLVSQELVSSSRN